MSDKKIDAEVAGMFGRIVEKALTNHMTKVQEAWPTVGDAQKRANAPKPSGGAGIKMGTRYGGGRQAPDVEPEEDDEKLDKPKTRMSGAHKNRRVDTKLYKEEELQEKLVGNQKKIDVNKNGKLDAEDFKKLRNMKEEDESVDEGMQQTLRKYVPGYAKHQLNKKMDAQVYAPGDSTKKTVDKDVNYGRYKKLADKMKKEEVEQIDELKKSTLSSYVKKAHSSTADAGVSLGYKAGRREGGSEHADTLRKRTDGVARAVDKLAKEETSTQTLKSFREKMEEPILDDLINEVLSKDASAGDWIHDFVNSDDPKFSGKSKAKRKEMALAAYYAKQRNEEVELEEGRGPTSQTEEPFVTNESKPLKNAKALASSTMKRLKNEMLGKTGTSE